VPEFLPSSFKPEILIRLLTMLSLGGLLLAVGLRLDWRAVARAVHGTRLSVVLPVNFLAVPFAAWALARSFALPPDLAAGMLLLSAAPFAPVVPVFVKMARGDLAQAAGLTAVFPVFCTFLTPLVGQAVLRDLGPAGHLQFRPLATLAVLLATVTLPLLCGMSIRRIAPRLARRVLRPLEVLAEAVGAVSLAFVTWVEAGTLAATGWKALMVMALAGELYFLLGAAFGGPGTAGRRVIAFGTANRNIALALLVAVDGFAGTPVVAAVVANGLLLIFLGLLHVAYFRFVAAEPQSLPHPAAAGESQGGSP
jgi:BASS family bile acid:Na+ symporter